MQALSRFIGARLAAFALLAMVAVGAAHAGDQDFVVVNETGVEIHRLYVSPSSSEYWEEDVLGEYTLPIGESLEITFSPKEDAALWDLRVEDADGDFITWEQLNLLEISVVTLHYDGNEAWADLE